MGNTNQRLASFNSKSEQTSPPRKRIKNLNGSSVSLRSIASFASNRLSNSSRNKDGARKRKHTQISNTPSTSTTGSIISIDRHWPSCTDSFEPEFPYTSSVSESDFVVLNALGQGRFAKVFRAIRRSTNQQVAIKIQNKAGILRAGAEEQIKNEVYVHRLLGKHKFIAEYFESWQTSHELFTSLEYVDGFGDLFSLFSEYGQFSEQMTCLYAVEIALGLDFLHQNSIIHRDLKMENCSLDSSLHIKFVDFGFSKQLGIGERTKTICGTLQFLAPEIAAEKEYGFEVDWFSFGITLFVMRTGQYPFPNNFASSHKELVFDRQDFPETCSIEFQSVIKKLLQFNPQKRLSSADELFRQDFFENVNIEGIRDKDVCPYEILKTENKPIERLKMQQAFDDEYYYKDFDFYFD